VNSAPVLIIVGGVHITIKLAQIAKTMGYKTIVIDPRRAFSTEDRFPDIDRLITSWPQEAFNSINLHNSTAVVTLSHDPKIDDPALSAALNSPVFYIGALGSKNTHQKRLVRLKESGLSDEQLDTIKSPVGIDIDSQSPAEIALAIMAEIVVVKNECEVLVGF
jgi:xanthine dehydrogenase accessory factor